MIKHDEAYYRSRKPQKDQGRVKNFSRFIWDPDTKTFLGRTPQEWMAFGLFYLCFYGVLFSFSGLQLWLTYKFVKKYGKPMTKLNRTLARAYLELSWARPTMMFGLSANNMRGPGIVMKPSVAAYKNEPLIEIESSSGKNSTQKYVDLIKKTLAEYSVDRSKYDPMCNDRILRKEDPDQPCFFDIERLGDCSKAPYGYTKPYQPCVYIKFNKRIGWLPIFYTQAQPLPENMPIWLQRMIQNTDKFLVWLSCDGKSESDRKHVGQIKYLPEPGFPVQYFPFNGEINYLAPMVALRFPNLTG
ncbi:hypothetical protein QAD02_016392 [Eretmocerus hayati]|uniref:Uncharacterized protein n=1 Tax=Eretmocerus hayati TaxID=131215 RepID=A0ACC2PAG3_9HYME|nr:hypothetical protein QAD02_016392 [Eretmocerus hayati]